MPPDGVRHLEQIQLIDFCKKSINKVIIEFESFIVMFIGERIETA